MSSTPAGADPISLPRYLPAPAPSWTADTDVVVVGSGIAGLTLALRLAEAGRRVQLVTKGTLRSGSTRWAQGGIAAALDPGDSPSAHLADTLVAGAGVCDEDAVRTLVEDGPAAVAELIARGARLDRTGTGALSLTREGGHHYDRITHAGGDATGAEVSRALTAAVRAVAGDATVDVLEHATALDLCTDDRGVTGLRVHVDGSQRGAGGGPRTGVGTVSARTIVLASGGLGQLFVATTNPPESTADGMAMALRAGAVLRDLEFVQFHPTVLWLGDGARGQQPLVSEAVRGEGAVLVDGAGRRVMVGDDGVLLHPMGDLAPRDVVASAIVARLGATGADHVYLDAREFGAQRWQQRFPTILAACREHGIDPVTDLIPVAPACHYSCGGVATDLHGRTSLPGLYACGEVACTGVHGANRLASNSLLEGLVFARRIADRLAVHDAAADLADWPAPQPAPSTGRVHAEPGRGRLLDPAALPVLRRAMTDGAGVLRDADGLAHAARRLADLAAGAGSRRVPAEPQAWAATNLLDVATALVQAASLRRESRGAHRRRDLPEQDAAWLGHVDCRRGADGVLHTRFRPASAAVAEPALVADLQGVAS